MSMRSWQHQADLEDPVFARERDAVDAKREAVDRWAVEVVGFEHVGPPRTGRRQPYFRRVGDTRVHPK